MTGATGPCSGRGETGNAREPNDPVRIAHGATAGTVRLALRGAAERLEHGSCQAVFSDFADTAGRPLREALERTGGTASGYLGQLLFYDGSRHRLCQTGRVIAVAQPGSRVVQVCPEELRNRYLRDPRYVEAILIHEALHSLGLGENPPTSFEITTRVIKRCTR
jgi:hypothetical protein